MVQIATGRSPAELVVSPLDGDKSLAAKNLRNALRDFIKEFGKDALAATLASLSNVNGGPASGTVAVIADDDVVAGVTVTGSGTTAAFTVVDGAVTAIALT